MSGRRVIMYFGGCVAKQAVQTTTPAAAEQGNDMGSRIATVAAIGIGAALIEVELIPGILIGMGAVLAPKIFPRLGNALRPLVKSAVRAGYALADKTKELAAETSEQLQDIVAEVKSESDATGKPAGAAETGNGRV